MQNDKKIQKRTRRTQRCVKLAEVIEKVPEKKGNPVIISVGLEPGPEGFVEIFPCAVALKQLYPFAVVEEAFEGVVVVCSRLWGEGALLGFCLAYLEEPGLLWASICSHPGVC